jgi:hypothetical protein
MGGVANYGNPAIVDGLIESITRLSATSNEMGWDKSEEKIRTRILSAYGVHPYILGEPVSVGGYAQAAKIEERFCKRVNSFLDLIGCLMSNFVTEAGVYLWWEETAPHDPSIHWANARFARKNNDISQNEFRALMGLPPDEDRNESQLTEGQMKVVLEVTAQLSDGHITRDQAVACFEGMGISDDLAKRLAGDGSTVQVESALTELRAAISRLNPQRAATALLG